MVRNCNSISVDVTDDDRDKALLIPDSCRVMVRSGISISADVSDDDRDYALLIDA